MNILNNIYESGKVVRYHANPSLSIYQQTDADHAWGCAALLCALHPNPSANLIAATIFHDSGEKWAGDIPYPLKLAEPELCEKHALVEYRLAKENGIPQYELTDEENKWIKFVDRLEAHLFCKLRRPDMCEGVGWRTQNKVFRDMAKELGVEEKLEGLMNE